jgi:AcrR family transcriptional regulator
MSTEELTPRARRENAKAQLREQTREEILAVAEELVRAHGQDALTLRKLASRMGFTPMALYSYFPDKQAILRALASSQFLGLAERLQTAGLRDGVEGLCDLMLAFVAYARDEPQNYRTLFMTPITTEETKSRESLEQENPAFRLVFDRVRACVDAGTFSGDPFAITTILWTAAHGTAMSVITYVKYPFTSWETYATAMFEIVLSGLRAHPVEAV